MIKSIFLNFDVKYEAPDFVLPGNDPQVKEEIINHIKGTQTAIVNAAQTLDLSATCTLFEFPGIGYLTRLEWLYFNLYHSQRHLRQIKNILNVLNAEKNLA